MTTSVEITQKAGISEDVDFGRGSPSLRNFAVVWAIASLFHMAHSGIFDSRLNLALLSIAALYVVFKPSLGGFIALNLLQLMDVVFRMPNVTNHWLFTAFVNITILQCLLYLIYVRKRFDVDEEELYNTFAPVVRWEVLILYFFAVFHKLNTGFFSPEVSCATDLLKAQHLDFVLTAFPALTWLNAYLTIIIELAIMVMLIFSGTRHAGVLLGFLFHLVLSFSSYNAFFDFTSMVIAVYFLFTAAEFNRRIDRWRRNIRPYLLSLFKNYTTVRFAIVCVGVALVFAVISALNKALNDYREFHLYFFWLLYVVLLAYLFMRFLFLKRSSAEELNFGFQSKWFVIMPLLVFLNGTSPYLGLKTENSYAMFSNLRTEGGVSNHFLIPANWQVFNFQHDLVEIISSDDAKLKRLADQQQLIVLFEFRNQLSKLEGTEVLYRINGHEKVYRKNETPRRGDLASNSALLSRLMKFRTISKQEPQPCAH